MRLTMRALAALRMILGRAAFWGTVLSASRSGSVAIYLAIAAVPLTGFLGLAVDTARAYLVRAQLSQALDAAALAGGRVIFSEHLDDDIRMFFDANFPPGFLGADVTGPTWSVDDDNEVLTISAEAQVPTTFLRVLGHERMAVRTETEVTRQTTMLDVVLAIDMSGSMTSSAPGGGSRIAAARTAAMELVNILYGDDAIKDLLNIGLVPWNSKVNVMLNGTTYDPSLTAATVVPTFTNPLTGAAQSEVYYANNSPVPLLSPPASDWKGCVFSRYKDDWWSGNDADHRKYDYSYGSGDWVAWEPIGPEGEPVPGWGRCSMAIGWNECIACLSRGITPLSHTKATITTAIQQLTDPEGSTNIPQGLGWAWRVLMPGAPFDEADPAPLIRRQQAIVLLTDGENYGGSGDGYKGEFGVGASARDEMDARLLELAANIKAEDVVIYTIQFANSGTDMQALLKQVATKPTSPFYHYAPDAATLSQVFREVANNLSELRLSK